MGGQATEKQSIRGQNGMINQVWQSSFRWVGVVTVVTGGGDCGGGSGGAGD
jgi:hypothetical protein